MPTTTNLVGGTKTGASSALAKLNVTTSPTCLCNSAMVAAPSTIWLLASISCPERTGGNTLACFAVRRIGRVRPFISALL